MEVSLATFDLYFVTSVGFTVEDELCVVIIWLKSSGEQLVACRMFVEVATIGLDTDLECSADDGLQVKFGKVV